MMLVVTGLCLFLIAVATFYFGLEGFLGGLLISTIISVVYVYSRS